VQVFTRDLVDTHCVEADWPAFVGTVALGESFVLETQHANAVNGPVRVAGIAAGEALAVHVEAVAPLEPFAAPNGGPFYWGKDPRVPLGYRDGYLHWPQGFRLKARPSVGNLAVLPALTPELEGLLRAPRSGLRAWRRLVNDPRGKHCHQDCPWLGAGAVLHLRTQVDGGGLCAGDVHVYQGQGDLAVAAAIPKDLVPPARSPGSPRHPRTEHHP
jgi:acetamidase/formamidase